MPDGPHPKADQPPEFYTKHEIYVLDEADGTPEDGIRKDLLSDKAYVDPLVPALGTFTGLVVKSTHLSGVPTGEEFTGWTVTGESLCCCCNSGHIEEPGDPADPDNPQLNEHFEGQCPEQPDPDNPDPDICSIPSGPTWCCRTQEQATGAAAGSYGGIDACTKYGTCPCYIVICDPFRPIDTKWGYIVCSAGA